MNVRWKLRMAAAQREVWTGAELRRLLVDKAGVRLSSASVSALMTKQPAQVKLSTLAALCTALECTPNDLFDVDFKCRCRHLMSYADVQTMPRLCTDVQVVDGAEIRKVGIVLAL